MAELEAPQRDPWDRWEVLTTPMSEPQARRVAEFINGTLPDVDALVESPQRVLRLAWDRDSVRLLRDGLVALRTDGRHVPEGIIGNLDHWLSEVAEG